MINIYQGETAELIITLEDDLNKVVSLDSYKIIVLLVGNGQQIRWSNDQVNIVDNSAIIHIKSTYSAMLLGVCALEVKLIDVTSNVVIAKCDTMINVKRSILGQEL